LGSNDPTNPKVTIATGGEVVRRGCVGGRGDGGQAGWWLWVVGCGGIGGSGNRLVFGMGRGVSAEVGSVFLW